MAPESIYYAGEIVWFKTVSKYWSVGVVVNCLQNHSLLQYTIQPFDASSLLVEEDFLRPWRVLSLVNLMSPDGQNRGIKEAIAISNLYQPFDALPTSTADEEHYTSAFLGAEKIWKGGPVTVRGSGGETFVMVVQRFNVKRFQIPTSYTAIGDLYKVVEKSRPNNYNTRLNPIEPTESLLESMINEIDFRRKQTFVMKSGERVWHQWKLLETQSEWQLNKIEGRWYQTDVLLAMAAKDTNSLGLGPCLPENQQLLNPWNCGDVTETIKPEESLAWLVHARISCSCARYDNLFRDDY